MQVLADIMYQNLGVRKSWWCETGALSDLNIMLCFSPKRDHCFFDLDFGTIKYQNTTFEDFIALSQIFDNLNDI